MMTIHFKNGETIEIKKETAKTLKENIRKGANDWQIFSDQNDNVFLFIKLSEINYID